MTVTPPAARTERCADVTTGAALRILVVDDDEMNREVLSRMMKRGGHNVVVAEDGHAALDILRRQPVDLVLLDQMMPGIDGRRFRRLIRTSAGPSELPRNRGDRQSPEPGHRGGARERRQ